MAKETFYKYQNGQRVKMTNREVKAYIMKINGWTTEQYNKQYESWYGKKILGTDFISIINKTIDNNEKNDIQKDENNIYIEDNEKSVKIYVKFLESDNIFDMEAISNNGIENFIQNYATFSFKCTKIDYHKNGNVKSLFFEEI